MADGGDGGPLRYSVNSGPTGRRQWPDEVKARIVAESFVPGVRVGEVARRNGVLPSQLTTWRRMAKDGHLALPWESVGLSGPEFVPLVVEEDAAPAEAPTVRPFASRIATGIAHQQQQAVRALPEVHGLAGQIDLHA